MKKSNITTIIFCITFLIWICFIANDDAVSTDDDKIENKFSNEFEGYAKVTDGDTIKIADKKIRLLYIDAPESSQTCFDKDYNEYNCGIIAKEFLINLVADKIVKCHYDKLDKYQRYLAECFIEAQSINNELVKNGMAVTYFFGHVNQEIADSQNQAQENKRGIWQGAFQLPKDYRKTHYFKNKAK